MYDCDPALCEWDINSIIINAAVREIAEAPDILKDTAGDGGNVSLDCSKELMTTQLMILYFRY